jgi:hypothetical protein
VQHTRLMLTAALVTALLKLTAVNADDIAQPQSNVTAPSTADTATEIDTPKTSADDAKRRYP